MPMAYAIRTVECESCGKTMTGRYKPNPPWLCFQCACDRMVQNIIRQHDPNGPERQAALERGADQRRQYRERSGPWYEKWVAGCLGAAGGGDVLPGQRSVDA